MTALLAGIAALSLLLNAALCVALAAERRKNRSFRAKSEGFPASRRYLSEKEKRK